MDAAHFVLAPFLGWLWCATRLFVRGQAGLQTPITIVLDNARYQRCRLVEDLATELGIELLFLGGY